MLPIYQLCACCMVLIKGLLACIYVLLPNIMVHSGELQWNLYSIIHYLQGKGRYVYGTANIQCVCIPYNHALLKKKTIELLSEQSFFSYIFPNQVSTRGSTCSLLYMHTFRLDMQLIFCIIIVLNLNFILNGVVYILLKLCCM